MKFLIQHNLMSIEQLLLTKEAVEPYPHEFVGIIPFSREITSNEPLIGTDFIPYGSTLFTSLALAKKWSGLHFNPATFNYQAATNNRSDMLNSELMLDIGCAISYLKRLPEDEYIFIRPSEDLKQFSGQVIQAKECYEWLQDALECSSSGSYQLSSDTIVVISSPKVIQAEWRWFIVGGKIISGSMYRCHSQFLKKQELDKSVIDEAQELAELWLPDPCIVMDTALVENQLKVIEFNCINSSGFYDHDVPEIFNALWKYHEQ